MNQIQQEQILCEEPAESILANLLKKTEEAFILNFAFESHHDFVVVGLAVIGIRFALKDASLEHFVDALASSLDKTAPLESFRNASISWHLGRQNVILRNAWRKTSRAFYFELARILAYKYGTLEPVVTVTDSVQKSLADNALVESRDLPPEQAIDILKIVITQVDYAPKKIIEKEKGLPVLFSLIIRYRSLAAAVFENDFRLAKMPSESFASTKQNKGSIGDTFAGHEFGSREQSFIRNANKSFVFGVGGPCFSEAGDRFGIEVGDHSLRADFSGEVRN
jgi:hypothetical protein